MKSALARAGSMSKLHGPRSLHYSEGSPQKQTPKTVKFDKTDEVIHYDVMTPELTEEYWDQISLQSCDSDLADRGDHDSRPLPAVPQFVLPSTLLRKEQTSPLQKRRTLMSSPIADDDDFDFNLQQRAEEAAALPDNLETAEMPEPLQSPQFPEPVLNAPSMSTRIDAMLASSSGMSPSLRGSSGHRRTDSQMSEISEASAPYLPLRSPQRYRPEEDEDDPAKWRDVSAAAVARQDSLQDNQRHPPTLKVSENELPPPVDLERTYSKRRKDLVTMLDPRTSGTAHSVGTIPEEAEESDLGPALDGEATLAEREVPEQSSPSSQHTQSSEPTIPHHHEITPLLSDDSQFIASQPSIPQSSSEVLQKDFDFGNDSFWKGGYMNGLREDTPEGHSRVADDTANGTIGISNEPAAQFAAGISPSLPDYTADDASDAHVMFSDHDWTEERDESPQIADEPYEDEDVDAAPMAREHSYLNIKDLRAEELDVGPTLAPVRTESDFFSIPASPERTTAAVDGKETAADKIPSDAWSSENNHAEDPSATYDQSTPQKVTQENTAPTQEMERRTVREAPQEVRQAESSDSGEPGSTSENVRTVGVSPEIDSPNQTHRGLPATPNNAAATVPRVRVLPWDPSIENFQTSPIPVPDRSPKRQPSPERGAKAELEAKTDIQSSPSLSTLQTSTGQLEDLEGDDLIDTELQELMASTSMHSSLLQNSEDSEWEQLSDKQSIANEDHTALSNSAAFAPTDDSLIDTVETSTAPVAASSDDLNPSTAQIQKSSIPASVPTLSPVAFSPFVPSLPSSPVAESSLKEPMAEVPAVGIDELVSSPIAGDLNAPPTVSPVSPSSQMTSGMRAKEQASDDSDASVPRGQQPHLDSDLSDFEVSPKSHDDYSEGTLRRPPIDDQSAWESATTSSSLQQSFQPGSPSREVAGPQSLPLQHSYSLSPQQEQPHNAIQSLTEDVSLREPSFGESMSSTLQHMLSQRSELGSDVLDRSYTLREYGSYVVATSPSRRQRRSQAFEVIRDDDGSTYSAQQLAIPRNRPLPTHSSLDQGQISRNIGMPSLQDYVRPPSVISRTDSSSYSLAANSMSSHSHPSSTMKGTGAARVASETKLGPIYEPESDGADHSLAMRTPAAINRELPPIIEPSLTESEDSVIAASSSRTGNEIQMLDHSLIQEDTRGIDKQAMAASVTSEKALASSKHYQPTIFPDGVLFLVVKSIHLNMQVSHDTLVALTLDNGAHCVTSAARGLSEIVDFAEEYRIGILDAPLTITLRLSSPSGPIEVPDLGLGSDGSFARLDVQNLRTQVFGNCSELRLQGMNHWASSSNTAVCTVDVSALYIPCVSHSERLPSRLKDAAERIKEARELLRERQARMQGVLRQQGGDITRHRGKQRWFVLDPVAPLLVAHSLRSHKARTLINLAKATSAAQVDTHKLEIRFRNEETLAFQAQSTLELAAWLRALRGCIGNDQNPRPKWIDAVIYESENGALSARLDSN